MSFLGSTGLQRFASEHQDLSAMAEVQKWTLKVSYQKEVRRLRDWPRESVCYENLKQSVLSLFDLEDAGQTLMYADEGQDGQECPLTSETLQTALETATAGLLRVTIVADETATELQGGVEDNSAEIAADPTADAVAPNESEPALQAGTGNVDQQGSSYYEGWARFKEQVVTDFRSNYQDMRGAVVRDEEDQHRGRQVAGHVAGLTAGVCATARLIPLHGTKLAARSIATAAKLPTPAPSENEAMEPEPAEPTGEVDRFKHQVFKDFETGRSEIQSAFGYFVGSDNTTATETHRPRIGRDVIPAVASTIAGLTVASTLVPLRATRLALASLAKSEPEPSDVPEREGIESQGGSSLNISNIFHTRDYIRHEITAFPDL